MAKKSYKYSRHYIFYISLLLLTTLSLSCAQRIKEEQTLNNLKKDHYSDPNEDSSITKKVIYKDINLDSLNYIDSVKNHPENARLEKLHGVDLINYLQSSSIYEHEDWRAIFRHWENDTLVTIPYLIYKRIFPDSFYYYTRDYIGKGESMHGQGDTMIRRFGTVISFQPRYHHYFSFFEKPDYVQLLVTTEGKYVYGLDLVTFSKPSIKFISSLTIFSSFCDAGDVDVLTPEFSVNKDTLVLKHIFNNPKDWEQVDSSVTTYYINPDGNIVKLKVE